MLATSEDYQLSIRQGPVRARVAGVKEKGMFLALEPHRTCCDVAPSGLCRSETSRPSTDRPAENQR